MISPSIGRVVWFYSTLVPDTKEQPQAAIVTYVHSDTLVNLVVFDMFGNTCGRTSVPLRQPEDTAPSAAFCEWMPYQIGQAKVREPESAIPDTLN